jgi:hypothetical protein
MALPQHNGSHNHTTRHGPARIDVSGLPLLWPVWLRLAAVLAPCALLWGVIAWALN